MTFQRIVTQRKSGSEQFRDGETAFDFNLLDFWQWSSSDLISNLLRGRVAEYLVAQALGLAAGFRNEWDSWDLQMPSGTRVEVKSAAYLQTWAQESESAIVFDIRPTLAWDADTNRFAPEHERRRHADVYIFALLAHRQKETLDPLDVSQWRFYVLPSSVLDERCQTQNQISLASLLKLQPVACLFEELRTKVDGLVVSRT